ncbi:hypothetical protein [Sediminimonas qiaohouensis]|uniref:hypothetical protein n=1 Tax=Sediminimonas qiaohouensis TaxID=552061 RepID=UPI0012ECF91D|nr:hypothetical protein [Sediminimonas qiaohouensis]
MLWMVERFAPMSSAVVAAGVAWVYLPQWSATLLANGERISNAFGPVFDLATFSAGSLFAIYVIALSRSEGFLGRIFKTETFRLFHRYVATAIAACVILSIWTSVYMVVGMGDIANGLSLAIGALWVGASTCALISVARVVLIFFMMVGASSSRMRGKQRGQTS